MYYLLYVSLNFASSDHHLVAAALAFNTKIRSGTKHQKLLGAAWVFLFH